MTTDVRVTLGQPRDRGDALVVPLAWDPSGFARFLPGLEGDVELAPLGPSQCRLTLSCSYVPPFGELGRQLDRALLHRVAQSTLRSFLARVARSIEDEDDPGAHNGLNVQGQSDPEGGV